MVKKIKARGWYRHFLAFEQSCPKIAGEGMCDKAISSLYAAKESLGDRDSEKSGFDPRDQVRDNLPYIMKQCGDGQCGTCLSSYRLNKKYIEEEIMAKKDK